MVERQQAARVRHWRDVYSAREEGALSWFEARPQVSLDLIEHYLPPGEGAAVIDVGGGTSRLVDALLERGYGPIAVLDIAGAALASAQRRLGPDADAVTWIAADITGWQPSRQWALWHDRAVFHFLTEERERAAYVAAMVAAIRPGGVRSSPPSPRTGRRPVRACRSAATRPRLSSPRSIGLRPAPSA